MTKPMTTIGVDIGGTKIAVGAVLEDGSVLSRFESQTPALLGGAAVVDTVIGLISRLGYGNENLHLRPPIGIGSCGVIDPVTGAISAASAQINDWAGTALRDRVAQATGVDVRVINDVHAHALGEYAFGAGRGTTSALVIGVGTGVGGAFIRGNVIEQGSRGAAGHLGHIPVAEAQGMPCPCGATGHLEAVASGQGLLELYRRMGGAADSAKEVISRVSVDPVARETVIRSASALGSAVGGLVNVFDPGAVVFSGGLINAGSIWWDALRQSFDRELIPLLVGVPVKKAMLGADAGIIGAALAYRSPHI